MQCDSWPPYKAFQSNKLPERLFKRFGNWKKFGIITFFVRVWIAYADPKTQLSTPVDALSL
jgi:hypothetical protein